jgi:hypothetical protein
MNTVNRTCRVGVHARNDVVFHDPDYAIIRDAKIETVKMMSQTSVDVFKRLKEQRSDIELITRLYDDRFGTHGHPSPEEFANRMIPAMKQLQPYSVKFEVHNEPNHLHRIEGWGDKDEDAKSFNEWFLRVYDILKAQCPWSQLGFPGLAIPHRDLEWVDLCRPAVEKSDWLGVHCYWQTPPDQMHNHLADFWGLRFKYYHDKFPDKIIDLTEVGNSNVQSNIPFTRESHAREFTEYLTECFKYPYLNSATFFIMSSPDPNWDGFCWRNEGGEIYPITWAIKDMPRPHWIPAKSTAPAPTKAAVEPTAQPAAAAANVAQLQQAKEQLQQQVDQRRDENARLKIQVRQVETENVKLQTEIQQLQAQLAAATTSQPGTAGPTPNAGKVGQPATTSRPAPPIHDISQQLSRNPGLPTPTRPTTQINRIIVHHTAVVPSVGAERIAQYLVQERGRAGIAYHYFITGDGVIQQTNDLTTVTSQSEGQINPVALGVGFAGDFTKAVPNPAQLEAGAQLMAWLIQQLNLTPQAVFGHKELINTQSPGLQWDGGAMWGNQLRQRIQALLAGAV